MAFHVRSAGLSDVGCLRSGNEDRWASLDQERCYLVADGLGGHVAGDLAAEMTIDLLAEYLRKQWLPAVHKGEDPRKALIAGVRMVHRRLRDKVRLDPTLTGMGTTLCCLCLWEGNAIYTHVGDSRIYRLRQGVLSRLTRDHSLASALKREGKREEAEVARSLYGNIVLQAIGASDKIRPSIGSFPLEAGDRFLICSDGLTDMASDSQIEGVLGQRLGVEEIAAQLVALACAAGGRDNVTVLVVEVSNGNA